MKITTASGAVYVIDQERGRACRLVEPETPVMDYDGYWFDFSSMRGTTDMHEFGDVEIGKRVYFTLRNHPQWDWRLTTDVVSIEEVDDELDDRSA